MAGKADAEKKHDEGCDEADGAIDAGILAPPGQRLFEALRHYDGEQEAFHLPEAADTVNSIPWDT